jgi:putative transposase
MPRRPRLVLPDMPLHLIQRGNNRQICFASTEDHQFYLDCLKEYAHKAGCQIHAYVLMTNHVHLLVSAEYPEAPGALMKALGQRYTQYVNRKHERSGTLWEGRYRSCPIQSENYLLACQRYIELNPVRAGLANHPADYRWSSYQANALGSDESLVTPHALYLSLGTEATSRQSAYQMLFHDALAPALLEQIRQATNGNFVLGNPGFIAEIPTTQGQRMVPGKPGRPRKPPEPTSPQPAKARTAR